MSTLVKIVVAILFCMCMAGLTAHAATTCQTVASALAPCRTYLQKGGSVPGGCCDGVRTLNKSANTTALRQSMCECIKSQAKANKVNQQFASSLPSKCNVKVPYPISFNTNCNSIH